MVRDSKLWKIIDNVLGIDEATLKSFRNIIPNLAALGEKKKDSKQGILTPRSSRSSYIYRHNNLRNVHSNHHGRDTHRGVAVHVPFMDRRLLL